MKVGNFKRKFNDHCPTCQTVTLNEDMSEIKTANKLIILRIVLNNDSDNAITAYIQIVR